MISIGEHIYVGRSKNFRSRMSSHYTAYENGQDCKLYVKMREYGGIELACSKILAFYNVDCIEDINWIEGYWMYRLDSDLNTLIGYKHRAINNYELVDFEKTKRVDGVYDYIDNFRDNHEELVVDYVLNKLLYDVDFA